MGAGGGKRLCRATRQAWKGLPGVLPSRCSRAALQLVRLSAQMRSSGHQFTFYSPTGLRRQAPGAQSCWEPRCWTTPGSQSPCSCSVEGRRPARGAETQGRAAPCDSRTLAQLQKYQKQNAERSCEKRTLPISGSSRLDDAAGRHPKKAAGAGRRPRPSMPSECARLTLLVLCGLRAGTAVSSSRSTCRFYNRVDQKEVAIYFRTYGTGKVRRSFWPGGRRLHGQGGARAAPKCLLTVFCCPLAEQGGDDHGDGGSARRVAEANRPPVSQPPGLRLRQPRHGSQFGAPPRARLISALRVRGAGSRNAAAASFARREAVHTPCRDAPRR